MTTEFPGISFRNSNTSPLSGEQIRKNNNLIRLIKQISPSSVGINLDKIKRVLEQGADVNSRSAYISDSNATALTLAIQTKNLSLIELLINHGAQIDRSQLVSAINLKDIKIVKLFLDKNPSLDLDTCSSGKESPLSVAIRNKSLDIFKLLVQRGAKVDKDTKFLVDKDADDDVLTIHLERIKVLQSQVGLRELDSFRVAQEASRKMPSFHSYIVTRSNSVTRGMAKNE